MLIMGNEEKQKGHGGGIDIDALVGSMERMMMPPPGTMNSKTCIFKTPEILSRHNEKAYLPNAFSVGPFHHGQPKLVATQEIKRYYLHGLLSRAPTPETNLRDLIKSIAELEGEARICYNAHVNFSEEEFTKMLLLDGCFLVELFRKRCGLVSTEEGDPVLQVPSMLQCLLHDLILLENQIPWFVLQRLYSMTTTRIYNDGDHDPLIEMVLCFLYGTFSDSEIIPMVKPTPPCAHILSLLRETMILSNTQAHFMTGNKSLYSGAKSTFPSATSLVEAGVKFRKLSSHSGILEIKFDNDSGVLEMSPFVIQDTTEAAFRNLISFEQCYPKCKPVITSYLMLLDDLIDTSKDLKILSSKGIISDYCCLDAEDATRVFNGLHNDCYFSEFYYTDLCKEVNSYCKRKWPRWRAMYLHNYFGTPWAIASQVVAAILLIFAFLQTFFTIIN